MLDLSRKLGDSIVIDDKTYSLNLAFNVVLKLFEMWQDKEVPEQVKPHFALRLLTGTNHSELTPIEAMEVFKVIFETHVQPESFDEDDGVEYDLAGNVMKPVVSYDEDEEEPKTEKKRLYHLTYDGEYIYAAFLQAYGLDLFEEHNRLHWRKFNALLVSLPEGTKFTDIIKIRAWKPSKGESSEYKADMRRLQREYRLPDDLI